MYSKEMAKEMARFFTEMASPSISQNSPIISSQFDEKAVSILDEMNKKLERLLLVFQVSIKEELNHEEAAMFLGVSTRDLYDKSSLGSIKFNKPGGKMNFYKKSDLREYKRRDNKK